MRNKKKKGTSNVPKFNVIRNHNYTITIGDSSGSEINFRDITGGDLEFFDLLFEENGEAENREKRVSFLQIKQILELLNLENINFGSLPPRMTIGIYNCVNEHILRNYIPKYMWLKSCYSIQNGSFADVLTMEKVPMTKFMAMVQINEEAIESIKND